MRKQYDKITLNGKAINFTRSWDEMTFRQYMRILNLKDDTIELISILTGLEYEYLKKAKIEGIEKVLYAAKFLNKPPDWSTLKATKIGKYKLPLNSDGIFDIQFESLAQFEDMRQEMIKTDDNVYSILSKYPKYCALYCQKIRDGEYDSEKAIMMEGEFMDYNAKEVITAGSFFLIGLQSLSLGIKPNYPKQSKKLAKNTGRSSRKPSGRTPRSTGYRGK